MHKLVAAIGDLVKAEPLTLGPTVGDQEASKDSPIGGDHSFYTYFVPGAIFQAKDGTTWHLETVNDFGMCRIRNAWYPREEATVPVADIRRSIDSWIMPVQQKVADIDDAGIDMEKSSKKASLAEIVAAAAGVKRAGDPRYDHKLNPAAMTDEDMAKLKERGDERARMWEQEKADFGKDGQLPPKSVPSSTVTGAGPQVTEPYVLAGTGINNVILYCIKRPDGEHDWTQNQRRATTMSKEEAEALANEIGGWAEPFSGAKTKGPGYLHSETSTVAPGLEGKSITQLGALVEAAGVEPEVVTAAAGVLKPGDKVTFHMDAPGTEGADFGEEEEGYEISHHDGETATIVGVATYHEENDPKSYYYDIMFNDDPVQQYDAISALHLTPAVEAGAPDELIPGHLRPFTKNDWYGFAGASKFPDGSEPMIGEVKLSAWPEETEHMGAVIIVGGDDETAGSNPECFVQVLSVDGGYFWKPFKTKEEAVAVGETIASKPSISHVDLVHMGFDAGNFSDEGDAKIRQDAGNVSRREIGDALGQKGASAQKSAATMILDVVPDALQDETFLSYLRDKGITHEVVNPNGPGGGNPEVKFTGDRLALEDLIISQFDDETLGEYIKEGSAEEPTAGWHGQPMAVYEANRGPEYSETTEPTTFIKYVDVQWGDDAADQHGDPTDQQILAELQKNGVAIEPGDRISWVFQRIEGFIMRGNEAVFYIIWEDPGEVTPGQGERTDNIVTGAESKDLLQEMQNDMQSRFPGGEVWTVARKQIGDNGQEYWNTRGPMASKEEAEARLAKYPEEGFEVVPAKMDGLKLVVTA